MSSNIEWQEPFLENVQETSISYRRHIGALFRFRLQLRLSFDSFLHPHECLQHLLMRVHSRYLSRDAFTVSNDLWHCNKLTRCCAWSFLANKLIFNMNE